MKKFASISIVLTLILGVSFGPVVAGEVSGTISLSGAWAIYPLAAKWGEAFQKLHHRVRFDISAGGAGKGIADALAGAVDIGMVSREVDKSEKAKGAIPIFIAKDAVFATVSEKNPAIRAIKKKGLSRKVLTDIFVHAKVSSWRQAIGGPSAPIHIYTRSDACGAASAWAAILGKFKQDDLKGIGVYGDPGVLEAVRRDPIGLGYNNLTYIFTGNRITRGIDIVPIDANRNGKVDPNERINTREDAYKEVASGRYPGSRREFFVTKGRPKGVVREFIRFALSDAGKRVLEQMGGYVPLSKYEANEQIRKIK